MPTMFIANAALRYARVPVVVGDRRVPQSLLDPVRIHFLRQMRYLPCRRRS